VGARTQLPKVELHLHLDCSLSWAGLRRLKPEVTAEEYAREFVAPARCANLAEFLSRVPKVLALLQSEEVLALLVEDVFEQLQQDGVIYAELRFAPLLHRQGGLAPERVVDVVDAAVERMARRTGIAARIILCTLRHYTEDDSLRTAALVWAFRDRMVVALDLAGDEAGFPLRPHVAAFRYAHEHGLRTTAHAGEALGPASVWETLEALRPDRIGHGVRSIEDDRLVARLRDGQVHLEVCPSSNVQLIESLPEWPRHPVDRLARAGVSLSINTDTRMLTPTTLTREHELMRRHFGWTTEMLAASTLEALRHAFADQATKATLSARVLEAVASGTASAG
jgi:adenosine deaminase